LYTLFALFRQTHNQILLDLLVNCLQVLCHLPLHKALPAHISALLQSVNRLRFYRTSGVIFIFQARSVHVKLDTGYIMYINLRLYLDGKRLIDDDYS
jgi:hypothetical protein